LKEQKVSLVGRVENSTGEGRRGKDIPNDPILCEEEMCHRGADIVGTEVTPPVVREDACQKVNHGGPGRTRRVGNLQTISHQKEVSEAELMKVQGGMSIRTVTVREAASGTKMSGGGSGI
jgi:hypothetical protein